MNKFLKIYQVQKWARSESVDKARYAHQSGIDSKIVHGVVGEKYVGDFVFGGIDGVVTTFAVVAGVAGAQLSVAVVLILGLANLLADGFAMGIGNFLSIKSKHESYQTARRHETWEVDFLPGIAKEEIETIYQAKGFKGEALKHMVDKITDNKKLWVETILREELGLGDNLRSPVTGGLVTLVAFIIIGFIPLLSFVVTFNITSLASYTFPISLGLTLFALFFTGAAKTLVVHRSWWKSGLETLIMGGLAATMAYVVGYLLKGLIA